MDDARPPWNGTVEFEDTTAANRTGANGCERSAYGLLVDLRICVDEEQHFAGGCACASVTHSRNLAVVDLEGARPQLFGKLVRRIGRGIVDHDHFIRLGDLLHRSANAAGAFADP